MAAHITADQQRMVFRLRSEGLSVNEVARAVGMHFGTVYAVLDGSRTKGGHPANWSPAAGHLTLADREEITIGLSRGERFTADGASIPLDSGPGRRFRSGLVGLSSVMVGRSWFLMQLLQCLGRGCEVAVGHLG